MLIPISHLKGYWKLEPRGTLHVGAHLGEEQADYRDYHFEPVVWIEAQTELVMSLKNRVISPSRVIQALVWNADGEELSFNITNNSQASSVFDFGSLNHHYPDIKVEKSQTLLSSRLDTILPANLKLNFLNLDIQGAEYQALEGLGDLLSEFDYVYSEVNRAQLYKGIKQITEIDNYLEGFGFVRAATFWTNAGWGDALYLKKDWAIVKFRSLMGFRIRVGAYWLWLHLLALSPQRLISWAFSKISRFSPNRAR
jgi:FkbM family methyltransferase